MRAGGGFIPYIVGHYWKKSSYEGAMAAVIVGSISVVLVEKKVISFFGLDPIFLGLLSSLIVFVIFSNIYPNKRNTVELVPEGNCADDFTK